MILKKAMINFIMIQTVIFTTSSIVGLQIPVADGPAMSIGFIWILAFSLSLIPSIGISFLFAYLTK